jgi:3-oxoacyl-[acyl-carrier-protein] synthase II
MQVLSPRIGDDRRLGILSGASGVEPATCEERRFLEEMPAGRDGAVRAYGSALGHGIEAHFIAGVALAALALSKQSFYAPFSRTERQLAADPACNQVVVTSFGHCCGEALGLVETVAEGGRG